MENLKKIKTAFFLLKNTKFSLYWILRTVNIFRGFFKFVLCYFGLIPKKNIILNLRNGVKYIIRAKTADILVLNENLIEKDNNYTPSNFKINPNDTVVDIGAHIGVFSILASKMANKGKVYAFEPSSDNFILLLENLKLNNITNIIASKTAVMGKEGVREMQFLENSTSNSFFNNIKQKNRRKIKVKTITLKKIIENGNLSKIDFLKMDCEGGEYEIFFNCKSRTLKKIKKISMEYHNLDKTRNVLFLKRFLEENRFDVKIKILSNYSGKLYAKIKD